MNNYLQYIIGKNYKENIINQILYTLIKNKNIYGGGGYNNLNNYNMIIIISTILIITVGILLCLYKSDYKIIEATIINIFCDNLSECKFNIIYTVNTIQYSKIIVLPKSNNTKKIINNIIPIYYKKSNPNIISLTDFNYLTIGLSLIVLGFFILIWYSLQNFKDDSQEN